METNNRLVFNHTRNTLEQVLTLNPFFIDPCTEDKRTVVFLYHMADLTSY